MTKKTTKKKIKMMTTHQGDHDHDHDHEHEHEDPEDTL